MTVLDAVNQILEGIGEAPVLVLDPGGTSDAAQAQTHLERARVNVLAEGWACTDVSEYAIDPPTVNLTVGGTGAFIFGERVTQAGSGAVGTFNHQVGTALYLAPVSGTFNGSGGLTGALSGTTRTVSAVATVTPVRIAVPNSWTMVRASPRQTTRLAALGGGDGNTYLRFYREAGSQPLANELNSRNDLFEHRVYVRASDSPAFDTLPHALAMLITVAAKMTYQVFKKRGLTDARLIEMELMTARTRALREDEDARQTNLLNTTEHARVRGRRWYDPNLAR